MHVPGASERDPGSDAARRAARRRAARVSLVGAVAIVGLKLYAWRLTGSVSLLSDAAESFVNVASALALIAALRLAARPADFEHPYGHQKAEYLSSVFEGAMILVAAGAILLTAFQRFLRPEPLEQVGFGLALVGIATVVNALLALYLLRAGRRLESAGLTANGRHVRTDVWTSAGVIGGVALAALTGWERLDPIVAGVVALNIVREGVLVLTTNLSRLMDERLPETEEQIILDALERHPEVLGYHRLRTRRSGRARFAELDLFVDPKLSVGDAHAVAAAVERDIHAHLDELIATLHVEPYVEGVRDERRAPRDEFPAGEGRESGTES
ncbi:cation diffusion facilitator family transporter [soil metagenome]